MNLNIPIVFAIDNDYVKQLTTVICSILKCKSKDTHFSFFVLNRNIYEEKQKIVERFVYSNDSSSSIEFININDYINGIDIEKYMSRRNNYNYISIETFFRFFIPDIFNKYEKIIYLDADILVFEDLKKLYDIDINNFYAGVIIDAFQYYHLENNTKPSDDNYINYHEYYKRKLNKKNLMYFNAGVLLFNIKEMIKDNLVSKLWDFTFKQSPLELQDQDVLNSVLESKVRYISYKWNVLKDTHFLANQCRNPDMRQTFIEAYANPYILHYVGQNKPWYFSTKQTYNYSFIYDWWKFYKKTPFFSSKDEVILTKIKQWNERTNKLNIICLSFFNFTILSISLDRAKLRITVFNFIKTNLRLYKHQQISIGG